MVKSKKRMVQRHGCPFMTPETRQWSITEIKRKWKTSQILWRGAYFNTMQSISVIKDQTYEAQRCHNHQRRNIWRKNIALNTNIPRDLRSGDGRNGPTTHCKIGRAR